MSVCDQVGVTLELVVREELWSPRDRSVVVLSDDVTFDAYRSSDVTRRPPHHQRLVAAREGAPVALRPQQLAISVTDRTANKANLPASPEGSATVRERSSTGRVDSYADVAADQPLGITQHSIHGATEGA